MSVVVDPESSEPTISLPWMVSALQPAKKGWYHHLEWWAKSMLQSKATVFGICNPGSFITIQTAATFFAQHFCLLLCFMTQLMFRKLRMLFPAKSHRWFRQRVNGRNLTCPKIWSDNYARVKWRLASSSSPCTSWARFSFSLSHLLWPRLNPWLYPLLLAQVSLSRPYG